VDHQAARREQPPAFAQHALRGLQRDLVQEEARDDQVEVPIWEIGAFRVLLAEVNRKARVLRERVAVTTSAGDVQYTLTGARERFRLLRPTDAYNYTRDWPLQELNRSAHRAMFKGDFTTTTGLATGQVSAFSFAEALDNGDKQVNVWPVPAGAEVLSFFGYNPKDDWTLDADVCYIPHRPIVDVALARARGERGEDGGIAASEQAAFALLASRDEIARDATQYDEDTTWEAV